MKQHGSSKTPRKVARSGAPIEVQLDVPLVTDQWRLVSASLHPDGFPLAFLTFASRSGKVVDGVRIDLQKAMLLDPVPDAVTLSEEHLNRIAERIVSELASRSLVTPQ